MTSFESTEALLAALVGGGQVPPSALAGLDVAAFCREAERHGVAPLVAERVAALDGGPSELAARLRDIAQAHAAIDLCREAVLRSLLVALDRAGVRTLLLKGAMLAYTHYLRPDLRPRIDTDLLISDSDRGAAEGVLIALGYQADVQAGTDEILFQRPFVLRHGGLPVHVVDLHWRLVNPAVFRTVLSHDEMFAQAVQVPSLLAAARCPTDVHALLVACVHRVAHHFDEERLIWLYDIHLVASRFDGASWVRFWDLAAERRVGDVCRASLDRAVSRFGTAVPKAGARRTGRRPGEGREVTARYLRAERAHAHVVFDDLRALPTWTQRWRMLRAHAFPPVQYMREVYAPASRRPLIWLYVRRIVRGGWKWLT